MAPSEKAAPCVLVIEDDASVASGIVRGLRACALSVELCTDGLSGANRACSPPRIDLVLLDLMLPGADGLDVLSRIRAAGGPPVVVLSARNALKDRLAVFEAGAVDFVPKPFWIEEIVARIRSRLHGALTTPSRCVVWDDVQVDLDARSITASGAPVHLTRLEFNILAYLLERPGRAISRAAMTDALLDLDGADARTVDSHIARMRRKMGLAASKIMTVWGVGYRFDPE